MVQYSTARLDASFAALSDATRRGVLEQLGRADASITELAEKFHMTLTGMKKHVGVLEQAGLVTTKKVGRVRTCRLGPRRLEEEAAWIERHRQLWAARFDALDKVVEELKQKERGRWTQATRVTGRREEPARRWNGRPSASWSSRAPSTGRRASCSRPGPRPSCSSGGGRRSRSGSSFISCEADVRAGGAYRFVFGHAGLGAAHGVLRPVHRSDAARPPRLDE